MMIFKAAVILLVSFYIGLLEAYINVSQARCCLHYDYASDGTAAGCGTPTDDRITGLYSFISRFKKTILYVFLLIVAPKTCNTCMAYQCLDWTVGSRTNAQREAAFRARTGQDVYFGVGSYGDNMTRAGYCYRLTVTNVLKDIIVQVVNQGNSNLL